jgi:hypothetical protein
MIEQKSDRIHTTVEYAGEFFIQKNNNFMLNAFDEKNAI